MTIKEKKTLADATAQSKGFDFAIYLGDLDGLAIYHAALRDPAPTGLPLWIEIDEEGEVNSDFGFKYMDLVKEK